MSRLERSTKWMFTRYYLEKQQANEQAVVTAPISPVLRFRYTGREFDSKTNHLLLPCDLIQRVPDSSPRPLPAFRMVLISIALQKKNTLGI